jgi:4-hydroxybenzoate polyprenyltransferase
LVWALVNCWLTLPEFSIPIFLISFFFITALVLPFDIRDMKSDTVKTFPMMIGVQNTKYIAYAWFSSAVSSEFLSSATLCPAFFCPVSLLIFLFISLKIKEMTLIFHSGRNLFCTSFFIFTNNGVFLTNDYQEASLYNFKNHSEKKFEFSPQINCFVGNNGVGKTNILDALHYFP